MIQQIQSLLLAVVPLVEKEKKRRRDLAIGFNVFTAIGAARKETTLSRFLAAILDPHGDHGQGGIFLTAFLGLLSADFFRIEDSKVSREHYLGDHGRADLRIVLGSGQVLILENKIDASEQLDQIDRYQRWLEKWPIPNQAKHLVIYLTPRGTPPSTHSVSSSIEAQNLSYSDLARAFTALKPLPDRMMVVINQFCEICNEIGGVDNDQ